MAVEEQEECMETDDGDVVFQFEATGCDLPVKETITISTCEYLTTVENQEASYRVKSDDTLNVVSPKLKYWSGQKSSKEMRYHNSETAHKGGCQRKLSRYQEFILTLMRLRLNLLTFFLVDVFGTSQSRVSQIYATWINFMHNVFSPLIRTPSRKQLRKHVPQSFKEKFPNTITIIDCTDIIVETQEHQQLSHSYIARIKAGILTKL